MQRVVVSYTDLQGWWWVRCWVLVMVTDVGRVEVVIRMHGHTTRYLYKSNSWLCVARKTILHGHTTRYRYGRKKSDTKERAGEKIIPGCAKKKTYHFL